MAVADSGPTTDYENFLQVKKFVQRFPRPD
jgi:hypothetical protein